MKKDSPASSSPIVFVSAVQNGNPARTGIRYRGPNSPQVKMNAFSFGFQIFFTLVPINTRGSESSKKMTGIC
jgi:hypothetical protein